MARPKSNGSSKDSSATIGFEATAVRDSAISKSEATLRSQSAAKDKMVVLPGQLFDSTQIPVCLWFLAKNKSADAKRGFRDRRQQTLFTNARAKNFLAATLNPFSCN